MSLESTAGATASPPLPLQFVSIELAPIADGRISVAMRATLLDEQQLEFVAEDLAHEHVATLDQALAVIRANVAVLTTAA